jgi:hypothetical protein
MIDIDLENNYSKIFDEHKLILHDRERRWKSKDMTTMN